MVGIITHPGAHAQTAWPGECGCVRQPPGIAKLMV